MVSSGADDPNKARVAPPPPPPPEVALQVAAQRSRGFDPKGHRLLIEVAVGVLAILALGGALIVGGGMIASWLTPLVPVSFDTSLGEMAASQFALQDKDCENPAAQAYVEELARPLIEAAGEIPFSFTFRVADTDQVNAFALPGGYVTVNYGLLQAAESGSEVAGVIGHEIQHALLRHGTKRMLRQMGGYALLALFFGGTDVQSLAYLAGDLVGLSYDRSQESEADQRGVDLMIRAGVDPRGFVSFFERLAEDGVRPPELLSTHPDPGNRAALVARSVEGTESFRQLPSPKEIACHTGGAPAEKK